MALGVLTSIRTAWVTAIQTAIDAGATGGKIKFYDGTRPATNGTATNLLGTVICSTTCGTVSNGVLTFSTFTDDSNAAASGTATWARITDSADTFVCDCSVGTSGADINLNSVSITAGGIIRITSGTLTAGNA
jgi:hypothetical protein